MIKIILAESHDILRKGIQNILERDKKFNVIGEACSGAQVMEMLKEGLIPDIILADVHMPEMTGLELADKIKIADGKEIKIVFLTVSDEEKYIFGALENGVSGYLLKDISADELVFALQHIAGNKRYISADLSAKMLHRAAKLVRAVSPDKNIDFSQRETEVLELIASGYTNQEIADKLYTSRRTVEGHRQSMINKANVRNSAELIRFAVRYSFIE